MKSLLTQYPPALLAMALLATGCSSPNGGPSSSAIERAFAHWQKGYEFDKQENLDAAIAEYTLAIQADPTDTMAYDGRAHDKLQKKDYEGAIADSGKCLALRPDDPSARMTRVLAERGKGDTNAAAQDKVLFDDQLAKWRDSHPSLDSMDDYAKRHGKPIHHNATLVPMKSNFTGATMWLASSMHMYGIDWLSDTSNKLGITITTEGFSYVGGRGAAICDDAIYCLGF